METLNPANLTGAQDPSLGDPSLAAGVPGPGPETVMTPTQHMREVVSGFNSLEGDALNGAVSQYLDGTVKAAIAEGGDRADIEGRLRAAWLGFSGAAITPAFGEDKDGPAVPLTFMSKIDTYTVNSGVLSANRAAIDHNETAIGERAETIKRDCFSYQDVLTDEAARQEALNYTEQSESADKYARALAKRIQRGEGAEIEAAKQQVRGRFDDAARKLPESLQQHMSQFAASESWIYWDLAKQVYMADNSPQTTEEYEERAHYYEADPLVQTPDAHKVTEDEKAADLMRGAIADRHLGWELQQMAANGTNMSELVAADPALGELLTQGTKEDGQFHSWQYADLGQIAARAF